MSQFGAYVTLSGPKSGHRDTENYTGVRVYTDDYRDVRCCRVVYSEQLVSCTRVTVGLWQPYTVCPVIDASHGCQMRKTFVIP